MRSESWPLSLGFMACVLRMRPPAYFLSIRSSIQTLGVGGSGGQPRGSPGRGGGGSGWYPNIHTSK